MSGFRKGAEEAKAASKSAASFGRTEFFKLEDGKSVLVRFLTDAKDWIVVDQHQMVPTKPKGDWWPKDTKEQKAPAWPVKMGAVCRKDPAFDFPDCYIDDHLVDGKTVKKPSARNWALACLREEVIEDGQVVGFRDQTREVKVVRDGKEETITEKRIVVVNMGYKNFFSILDGFASRYKTILDRDYFIKREGDDTSTIYQIVPNDPLHVDGEIFDLREPKFMERYKTDLNLEEVITERASDEFYAKFFDPRFTVIEEKDGDKHLGWKVVAADDAAVKAAQAAQARSAESSGEGSGDVDPERLAALANRVKNYGGDAPSGEAAAESGDSEQASAEEAQKEPAAAAPSGMRDFG